MKIKDIIIGERRRDLKKEKIEKLAKSIRILGLINPVTVNSINNRLICGLHRLRACESLGWEEIEVNLKKVEDPLFEELEEIDENLLQDRGTELEQANDLKRRKEIYEIMFPETRREATLKQNLPKGNNYPSERKASFVKDTANKTQKSESTVKQSVQIATNISQEIQEKIHNLPIADSKTELLILCRMEPEQQGGAVKKILTGEAKTVKQAKKQIRRAERQQEIENIPLSELKGKYNVFLADPPWQYDNKSTFLSGVAEEHYPTMDIEEIKELPIKDMTLDKSVLFLWTTTAMIEKAFSVIEAWGFTFKTSMVWVKPRIGTGFYVRGKHEIILIATKGSFLPMTTDLPASVFFADTEKHSKKPDIIYNIIEKMYPGQRYIELFHRGEARKGWHGWGFESGTLLKVA